MDMFDLLLTAKPLCQASDLLIHSTPLLIHLFSHLGEEKPQFNPINLCTSHLYHLILCFSGS